MILILPSPLQGREGGEIVPQRSHLRPHPGLQCRSQGTLIEQVDIVLGVASRIFADEAGEIGPFRWNALHGHRRLRPWRQWRASKSAALAERERAATREGRMERSRALAARQIGFKADDTALLVVVHIHENPTKIIAANWKGKKNSHTAAIALAQNHEKN